MSNKIEGCRLCLCKCGGEYVTGVHIEFFKADGKLYPVPVNTKVDQSHFDYKMGEYDARRAIGYIENGFAFIADGYVWIDIENKTERSYITEAEFNAMVHERVG